MDKFVHNIIQQADDISKILDLNNTGFAGYVIT